MALARSGVEHGALSLTVLARNPRPEKADHAPLGTGYSSEATDCTTRPDGHKAIQPEGQSLKTSNASSHIYTYACAHVYIHVYMHTE